MCAIATIINYKYVIKNIYIVQTCVLSGVQELSLIERERPTPQDNEALVKIDRVGICGSDIHYYQHGKNSDNSVEFPHVLGHESAGTVVELGEDVTSVCESARVAIEPGISCGECTYCRADGEYHLCKQMRYMSSPPIDGALTEYIAWPADLIYPLPSEVSLQEGALVEPLSVAIHACDRGNVTTGDSVLITGAGPIGQLISEVALAKGAEVVMTDMVKSKLELAEQRGVHHTIDITSADPLNVIQHTINSDGVDIVIESSGAESAIRLMTNAIRRGGTGVFVGIPIGTDLPTDVVGLISNEYELRGSFRFSNTYQNAVDGIQSGQFDVNSIVSFEQKFTQTQAAFNRALESESVKGVIRVSDDSE